MGDLSTLFLFKQFAGITDNSTDDLLARLISQVTAAVESRCDRTFGLATYRSWLDGEGGRTLLLPAWPISYIRQVAVDIDNAARITFSGGAHAEASVDGTTLRLATLSTTGAESTTNLAVSSYATVAALGAAISAVAGWTYEQLLADLAQKPPTLLQPLAGEWCLAPDYAELMVPDDGIRVARVPQTNRAIERYDGACWPSGPNSVFVWYRAGYTLPVDAVGHGNLDVAGDLPGGLSDVFHRILLDTWRARDEDGNMAGESEGGYSFSRHAMTSALERHWPDLAPFANLEV